MPSVCWSLDDAYLWNGERGQLAAASENLLGLVFVVKLCLDEIPRAISRERCGGGENGFAIPSFFLLHGDLVWSSRGPSGLETTENNRKGPVNKC